MFKCSRTVKSRLRVTNRRFVCKPCTASKPSARTLNSWKFIKSYVSVGAALSAQGFLSFWQLNELCSLQNFSSTTASKCRQSPANLLLSTISPALAVINCTVVWQLGLNKDICQILHYDRFNKSSHADYIGAHECSNIIRSVFIRMSNRRTLRYHNNEQHFTVKLISIVYLWFCHALRKAITLKKLTKWNLIRSLSYEKHFALILCVWFK